MQYHRDGVVRDLVEAVIGHVCHEDALRGGSGDVHGIDADAEAADDPAVVEPPDDPPRHGSVVDDHDSIRVARRPHHLILRGALVLDHLRDASEDAPDDADIVEHVIKKTARAIHRLSDLPVGERDSTPGSWLVMI